MVGTMAFDAKPTPLAPLASRSSTAHRGRHSRRLWFAKSPSTHRAGDAIARHVRRRSVVRIHPPRPSGRGFARLGPGDLSRLGIRAPGDHRGDFHVIPSGLFAIADPPSLRTRAKTPERLTDKSRGS